MRIVYNWEFCQINSDEILGCGLKQFESSKFHNNVNDVSSKPGNYLFTYKGKPMYIGETGNLFNRIKQQQKPNTSTFYKNYLKKIKQLDSKDNLSIDNFDLQLIEVNIGRKELEEFGIVNLPTPLNKFQIGKRNIYKKDANNLLWGDVQSNYPSIISDGAAMVLNKKPTNWFDASVPNGAGIYIVKDDNNEFIYVGESSNVLDRYKTHSSNTYFSAFRRNLGTGVLGFRLKEIKGRKRYFDNYENNELDDYIKYCKIIIERVHFGRYELEEHLISTLNPVLNRKSKKKIL